MRWEFGRRSRNVEDRRGEGMPTSVVAGGGIGAVLLALVIMFLGGDPSVVFDQGGYTNDPYDNNPNSNQATNISPEEEKLSDFVSVVLASTEDTWQSIFQQEGATYQDPKLVLFSGAIQSACGNAQSAMGPFYCPRDEKVYIDLSFYQDLKNRYQAPGDFAQAYVIAHEVGHHVQNLLGISDQVQSLQQRTSPEQANRLSVRLELQADCLAGVWANRAQKAQPFLEQGDVEEALNAASSIGDDRLQQETKGYVVPESFTHGTSAQRVRWFKQGFQTGDINQCNTFDAARL